MQTKETTQKALKEDILKQFEALENLNITLSKKVSLISFDVGYRYSITYSKVKTIIQRAYIEYTPKGIN